MSETNPTLPTPTVPQLPGASPQIPPELPLPGAPVVDPARPPLIDHPSPANPLNPQPPAQVF